MDCPKCKNPKLILIGDLIIDEDDNTMVGIYLCEKCKDVFKMTNQIAIMDERGIKLKKK